MMMMLIIMINAIEGVGPEYQNRLALLFVVLLHLLNFDHFLTIFHSCQCLQEHIRPALAVACWRCSLAAYHSYDVG
jgi:hypothetical protein